MKNAESSRKSNTISFIHGYINSELNHFSKVFAIPEQELTSRVAELLLPEGKRAA